MFFYTPRPRIYKTFVPVVDTSANASGDALGTVTKLDGIAEANGKPFDIVQVNVVDLAKQSAALVLHFYSKVLTTPPVTNAAFDPDDADEANFLGTIELPANCMIANNDSSHGTMPKSATPGTSLLHVRNLTSNSLWVVVTTTGTPTYGVATDLKITLVIDR